MSLAVNSFRFSVCGYSQVKVQIIMRQRPLLIASIFVNVALAALYLAAKQRLTPANSTSGSAGSQSRSNAVKTVSVLRQQFFSWEQVESADYATYIKNLRDIGCPEQ